MELDWKIILGVVAIIVAIIFGILQLTKNNKETDGSRTNISQKGSNNTQTNNITNNHE